MLLPQDNLPSLGGGVRPLKTILLRLKSMKIDRRKEVPTSSEEEKYKNFNAAASDNHVPTIPRMIKTVNKRIPDTSQLKIQLRN